MNVKNTIWTRFDVFVVILALIGWFGVKMACATSVPLTPLGVEGEAKFSATHVLELNYSDFVGYVGSNITAVNTNFIPFGSTIVFKGMRLETPYNSTLSAQDATAVYCGIASDTDRFLTSTTIASDGTEVWTSPGNLFLLEQGLYIPGGTNAVTNVIDAALYCNLAGGTNILTTLRDNSLGCLGTNVAGKVKLYFRLLMP
jgi:hypothetical protein